MMCIGRGDHLADDAAACRATKESGKFVQRVMVGKRLIADVECPDICSSNC